MEKKCFKCGEVKPLSNFYKHPRMADGHVNKCKECNKRDVRKNRSSKVDYYREYDRKRGNRQTSEYRKSYSQENPIKARAQRAVAYAVRNKKLFREPCEICGSEEIVHAHHDDYAKPLNVRWLCPAHHFEWHKENGEGKNSK